MLADQSAASRVAAEVMKEEDVGSVPVVEEEGRLAGIVTDRDIVTGPWPNGAIRRRSRSMRSPHGNW